MKAIVTALAFSSFALLGACEGGTDENLAAAAENATADLGAELEDAASEAGNVAEQAGEALTNSAETLAADLDDGENAAEAENAADAQ